MRYHVAELLKESIGSTRVDTVDDEYTTEEGDREQAKGRLHLMRTDKGILASASVETWSRSMCRRCLKPLHLPVTLSIEEEYLATMDIKTGASLPLPPEAIEEGTFAIDKHHVLDLQEAVRQHLIVNRPVNPLCQEDCQGLCATCGADLNVESCHCQRQVDPRLMPLAKLLQEGSQ
ncbi:MAG: DUF177 domain-containing protein [Dehalococcoidia bacterium]